MLLQFCLHQLYPQFFPNDFKAVSRQLFVSIFHQVLKTYFNLYILKSTLLLPFGNTLEFVTQFLELSTSSFFLWQETAEKKNLYLQNT